MRCWWDQSSEDTYLFMGQVIAGAEPECIGWPWRVGGLEGREGEGEEQETEKEREKKTEVKGRVGRMNRYISGLGNPAGARAGGGNWGVTICTRTLDIE